MLPTPVAIDVPIKADQHGVVRVSGTRVPLVTLIDHHNKGESPQDIHDAFPVIPLSDIYVVIAYYLANQASVDAYVDDVHARSEQTRQQWEARYTAEQQARLDALRQQSEQNRNA